MTLDTPISTPYRFGNYILLSAFARGGMGDLFLAKSETSGGLDRLCVVKRLRPDVTKRQEYVNRFVDEARVVLHLNHSHICSVYDFGQVKEEYYLAMEHIAGLNLQFIYNAMKDAGRQLPTPIGLYIVCEVLDALDYAHSLHHPIDGHHLHLVHRDVSPQNVIVGFEGETKLIDFGLARSELKIEQTDSAVVMGKVAYMSPEQARGETVSPASDQYAAAVVLYELLTGERFFGNMPHNEIWATVGKKSHTPEHWDKLDPAVQLVLQQALAFDPEQRFESSAAFRDALDTILKRNYPSISRKRLRSFMQQHFRAEQQKEQQYIQALSKLARNLSTDDLGDEVTATQIAALNEDASKPANMQASETVTNIKQPEVTIAEFDQLIDQPLDIENFEQTDRVPRPSRRHPLFIPLIAASCAALIGLTVYRSTQSTPHKKHIPIQIKTTSLNAQEPLAPEQATQLPQGDAEENLKRSRATSRKRVRRHPQVKEQLLTTTSNQPTAQKRKPTPRTGTNITEALPNKRPTTQRIASRKPSTRAALIRQLSRCQAPCAKILTTSLSKNIEASIPKSAHYTIAQCQKTCNQ